MRAPTTQSITSPSKSQVRPGLRATALTERRELAHRSSDGIEVTLLWSKPSTRVTIALLDSHSAEALVFEVDGSAALDAFNHPYAYAATRQVRALATTLGGRTDGRNEPVIDTARTYPPIT
jgi:hypothetical protein